MLFRLLSIHSFKKKEGVVENMLENPQTRTIWKRIWSLSAWLDPNCCTDVRRLWDFSTDDETTDKKLDEKERLLLYNCPSSPKGYVSPLSYTICMQIYIILDSDGTSLQIPSSSLRLPNPRSSSPSRCRARAESGPSLRLDPSLILEFSVACTPSPFIAYFSHCQRFLLLIPSFMSVRLQPDHIIVDWI